MIVLTNSAAQTVAPGAAVTFNTVRHHTGKAECSFPNSNAVKLRTCGVYEVHFSGNISGTAAGTPVQLAIAQGGVALPETVMVSTPAAANDYNNVATTTPVVQCCNDFNRITVVNTGTVPVNLSANMLLYVHRIG